MQRLDIECFDIKYKKSKSSARRMGKYKAKEVKELSEYVKANKNKHKTLPEEIKSAKTVMDKVQRVEEFVMGPKHKPAERCAIFGPVTNELILKHLKIKMKTCFATSIMPGKNSKTLCLYTGGIHGIRYGTQPL